MSPKQPSLTARELVRRLEAAGFACIRQRGSHARFRHEDGRAVTVPMHARKQIPTGTLHAILKQAKLKV